MLNTQSDLDKSQEKIGNKIIKYLDYLKDKNQENDEEDDNLEKLQENIGKGLCAGISFLWLYSQGVGTQQNNKNGIKYDKSWFDSIVGHVVNWESPNKNMEELKNEINSEQSQQKLPIHDREIDRFISLIQFFQNDTDAILLTAPDDVELSEAFGGVTASVNVESSEVVENTKKTKLKRESSIASLFKLSDLEKLLNDGKFKEGKLILISSHDHTTALFKKDNTYYYFNPNDKKGAIEYTSTSKLAEGIFKANFYINSSYDINEPSPLGFRMFSLDDSNTNTNVFGTKGFLEQQFFNNNSLIKSKFDYYTGLIMAADIGCSESADYFLEKWGKNLDFINYVDGKQFNALTLAISKGYEQIALKLIKYGAACTHNSPVGTALILASEEGLLNTVDSILQNDKVAEFIDKNDELGYTALMLATQAGHKGIVEKLLNALANPNLQTNTNQVTALMLALTYVTNNDDDKYAEIAISILTKSKIKVDVNKQDDLGYTALMLAIQANSNGIVKALLDKGTDLNLATVETEGKKTALMIGCEKGNNDIVDSLLNKEDIKLNGQDSEGYTALMLAIAKRHNGIAKKLIDEGANINIQTNEKNQLKTALMIAIADGNNDGVNDLIKADSIDINKQDAAGWTAPMLAIYYNYKNTIKDNTVSDLLNCKSIDLSVKNKNGVSLLMLAAHYGNVEVIKKIIGQYSTEEKEAALDCAKKNKELNNEQIKNVLSVINFDVQKKVDGLKKTTSTKEMDQNNFTPIESSKDDSKTEEIENNEEDNFKNKNSNENNKNIFFDFNSTYNELNVKTDEKKTNTEKKERKKKKRGNDSDEEKEENKKIKKKKNESLNLIKTGNEVFFEKNENKNLNNLNYKEEKIEKIEKLEYTGSDSSSTLTGQLKDKNPKFLKFVLNYFNEELNVNEIKKNKNFEFLNEVMKKIDTEAYNTTSLLKWDARRFNELNSSDEITVKNIIGAACEKVLKELNKNSKNENLKNERGSKDNQKPPPEKPKFNPSPFNN